MNLVRPLTLCLIWKTAAAKESSLVLELLGSLDQRLQWQATQHLPPQLHLHPRLTAFHILQHPQLLLGTIQLLLEFLVSPLLDWEVLLGSIWVPKEENLRRRGLYCRLVLSERLMEKQGPP